MTPAQLATLKASINADPVLSLLVNNSDTAFRIAQEYNLSVAWTVWKTNVPVGSIGRAFNGADMSGMPAANQTRLQTIAVFLREGVNPSLPDNRAMFDDAFAGGTGATTRASLAALWKRQASRAEKLFSTGTGSDATPATMGFEGLVSYNDVQEARV